ncbi:hypothetical protein vseg_009953 [Gypsophila vaccaria]
MGCFSTCFDACKPSRRRHIHHHPHPHPHPHRRHRSRNHNTSLLHHLQNYQSVEDFNLPKFIQQEEKEEEKEEEEVDDHKVSPDSIGDEIKEDANLSGRKKVTFDLNVKFYEDLTRDDEDGDEDEVNEEEIDEIGKKYLKGKDGFECGCGSDSSLFSYPSNHRYQNCRDSDDDDFDGVVSSDESDTEEYSDEDGGDDEVTSATRDEKLMEGEEESSESLFSLSIDSRKHRLGSVGVDKEVNSPMPIKNVVLDDSDSRGDRRNDVDSVLNPVENLTQWKDMKARSRVVLKDRAKENLNSVHDFSFPAKNEKPKEMAVDTSLSTWLVGSEHGKTERGNSGDSPVSVGNSPSDRNTVSPNKFEDRPILGALTLEEIRMISASSTPRKSPTRSPDDMPIIGSVGSYWSHTGQTTGSRGSSGKSTKSRYRESAEVIWDSTPFEARLEKALEKEANSEEVFAVLRKTQTA